MWRVSLTKKAAKQTSKLGERVREALFTLIEEMKLTGPIRGNWPNFSKLAGGKKYHCHLKKGKPTYVVCWQVIDKKVKLIEVNYVGTHEKAPY